MAKQLVFLLLLCAQVSFAQRQNDTWVMGSSLGMQWNLSRIFTPIADPVGGVNRSHTFTSCISNPKTGKLLAYADQRQVYNANFEPMANGRLNTPTGDDIASILLLPLANNKLYIFAVSAFNNLSYALIDLNQQNGLGALVSRLEPLNVNTDKQMNAVRMPNGQGYWLITHINTSTTFVVFPIAGNGTIGQRVISEAGEITIPPSIFNTGELFSTTNGERFIYMNSDPNGSVGNPTLIQEFTFDKRCGKVAFKNRIDLQVGTSYEFNAFGAYSTDNSLLYIGFESASGGSSLIQFDMTVSNPTASRLQIASTNEIIGDMQTAPDGKIYIASSIQRTFTSRISVIQSPNNRGAGCGFAQNAIELSRNPFLGSIGVERFPQLINDIDTAALNSETPTIAIDKPCLGASTRFTIIDLNKVLADSFYWELSDGNQVRTANYERTYTSTGKDSILFVWFLCGRKNELKSVFEIGTTPSFTLGSDTTICFGSSIKLSGPPNQTAYQWSTGDTTESISVTTSGTYVLGAFGANCPSFDTILIKQYEPIFTALGDEYFICEDDRELVRLDAGEQFAQYKWSPTGDTTQWIVVGNVGDYFVVVKDFRGCDGSDGTRVKRKCGVVLTFPNAFTPNNDGLNDGFGPTSKDLVSIELTIYNRWGDEVWRTQKVGELWNGEVNGVPAVSGVYTYSCSYTGFENKIIKSFNRKGTFTLLR